MQKSIFEDVIVRDLMIRTLEGHVHHAARELVAHSIHLCGVFQEGMFDMKQGP